jgi:hypothetical protein
MTFFQALENSMPDRALNAGMQTLLDVKLLLSVALGVLLAKLSYIVVIDLARRGSNLFDLSYRGMAGHKCHYQKPSNNQLKGADNHARYVNQT